METTPSPVRRAAVFRVCVARTDDNDDGPVKAPFLTLHVAAQDAESAAFLAANLAAQNGRDINGDGTMRAHSVEYICETLVVSGSFAAER